MAVTLGSNISAQSTTRRLAQSGEALQRTLQRLGSGLRINRASDDAAGLSIASRLNTDSRVYTQAIRNANDGISALSITEGALDQMGSIVMRLKELAQGASNGSFSTKQRITMDREAVKLVDEYNRITESTSFNGRSLLAGSGSDLQLQLGYGSRGALSTVLGQQLGRAVIGGYQDDVVNNLFGMSSTKIDFGDFDNDGIQDVVQISAGVLFVNRLSKSGQGSPYPMNANVSDFAMADLNNDGNLDIIYTIDDGSGGSVNYAYGDGAGGFGSSDQIVTGHRFKKVAVGDFDGDGRVDIAAAVKGKTTVDVFGNSQSGFEHRQTLTGGAEALQAKDFNGDGRVDLLASDGAGVFVSLSLGSGGFGATQMTSVYNITHLMVADFNRDGILDFVNADLGYSNIQLRLGNGDGTFGAEQSMSFSTAAFTSATLGDYDSDGYMDIIVGTGSNSAVIRGNGDGSFKNAELIGKAADGAIAFADLNGDGTGDLVYGTTSYDYVVNFSYAAQTTSISHLDLTSQSNARSAITTLDSLLESLAREKGSIGAAQSRVGSALNTLGASRENAEAAAARITNADVASEAADLTRTSILQRTAAALLAQVNRAPEIALELLR